MSTARSALVTGGASGLCAATAERLRAEGMKVITLDLLGADVTADVADEDAMQRIADEVGAVDVLVNSAGIVGPNKPLTETSADGWRRVFDVNVVGTASTMRAFVPGMCERAGGGLPTSPAWPGRTATRTCPSTRRPRLRHRPDQARREGAGHHRRARQRHRPCGHRHPDERRHSSRGPVAHH
jgi:NADP-dependent 3-hydroxy acid dehydrogenase YdfG